MKTLFAIFLALLLIIVGLIYFQNYNPQNREAKPAVVTIGWIGPLSGNASPFGLDNYSAVKLALTEYHATKKPTEPNIRLVIADDAYDPEKTVQAYHNMVTNDLPQAIIMMTYSGVEKLANEAQKQHILLIDDLDNDLNLSGYNHNVFLIAKETEALAGIYANEIIARNRKNVAILSNNSDDFMKSLASTIIQILNNSNVATKEYEYSNNTTDFKTILQEAKDNKADAYIFLGYGETAKAIRQARDLGILSRFYAGSVLPDPAFKAEAKDALEGTFFVYFGASEGNENLADAFLRSFNQSYRRSPNIQWVAMQGYDAANILIKAIKQAYNEAGDFEDNLRNSLLSIKDYPGVSGNLTIQHNGSVKGIKPALYIYKNNRVVKAIPRD